MSSTCSFSGCGSNTYNDKNKCILHCDKEIYSGTSPEWMNEQNKFYVAILDYIVEQLCNDKMGRSAFEQLSFVNSDSDFKHKLELEYKGLETEEQQKECLKEILEGFSHKAKIKHICFSRIHFPKVDSQRPENYRNYLNLIEDIVFRDCTFYGHELKLTNSQVYFQDCIFCNKWQLWDYKINESSTFIYCSAQFKKKINGIEGTLSNTQFNEYCSFDDGAEFTRLQIQANVFGVNGHTESRSEASHYGSMKGRFNFTDCTFSSDQEIYLANAKEAEFLLKSCKFERKLKIRGLEYSKGYEYQQENKAALKSLTFNSCQIANNEDSYLRIGFLKECKFELKNLKNQSSSELNIGDCHFTTFLLTNFRNLGKFKLYKINDMKDESGYGVNNERFTIDNTSIGNTDFQSINLTSFSKVFMFDNIFSEVNYTNVQWPSNINVDQFQEDKNKELTKKRDTYRTLKNVALKNNDRSQALQFYAQEMECHKNILNWSPPQFGDKLTLLFNYATNGFGLNWWIPLILLLGLSCLFYAFLWTNINSICAPDYSNYLGHYWTFLNPARKTEFVAPGCWNGMANFIDFLFRILQAFLIYQIIQAFRKFSRSL